MPLEYYLIMKEKISFEYSVDLCIYPNNVTEYSFNIYLGTFPSLRVAHDRANTIVQFNSKHLIIPNITKIEKH